MALNNRIVAFEGNITTAYPDPNSSLAAACQRVRIDPVRSYSKLTGWEKLSGAPWTIGNGHTGGGVRPGLTWSQAQIDAQRALDIADARTQLAAHFPWARQVDSVRRDVLVELVFSMGATKLATFGDFLRLMQAGRFTDGAADLQHTKWAGDVGDRRSACLARIIRTGHDE